MPPREILVVKRPRASPLADIPINFPPLYNLHLELVENKKKLKKGLPLNPVSKKAPVKTIPPAQQAPPQPPPREEKKVEPPKKPDDAVKRTDTSSKKEPDAKKVDEESKKTAESRKKDEESKNKAPKDDASSSAGSDVSDEGSISEGSSVKSKASSIAESKASSSKASSKSGSASVSEEDKSLVAKLGDEGSKKSSQKETPKPPSTEGVGATVASGAAAIAGAAVGVATQVPPVQEAFTQPPPAAEPDDIYAGLSPEERESKEKEEYIWRFRILKKQYKNRGDIPAYNEHSDLKMMKTTYERTLKDLTLEDNVDTYRTYLIGSFMVMEWVATQWVGFDLNGFTQQQMVMMHRYDRLLTELGERSYNRWGMNLPVEVRLLGFVVLQAGLFYLGKIIAEKGGSTISELFKSITGQTPGAAKPTAEAAPTQVRKMRGPSIRAADIHSAPDTGQDASAKEE